MDPRWKAPDPGLHPGHPSKGAISKKMLPEQALAVLATTAAPDESTGRMPTPSSCCNGGSLAAPLGLSQIELDRKGVFEARFQKVVPSVPETWG